MSFGIRSGRELTLLKRHHQHEHRGDPDWPQEGERTTRLVRTLTVAGGILYLGYLRSQYSAELGRELWLSNSDARKDLFLAATTGGGKSEKLICIAYNALYWGSGFVYADGKASSNVQFCLLSLARRRACEDDILVLNFLTGRGRGSFPRDGRPRRWPPIRKGDASTRIDHLRLTAYPKSGHSGAPKLGGRSVA